MAGCSCFGQTLRNAAPHLPVRQHITKRTAAAMAGRSAALCSSSSASHADNAETAAVTATGGSRGRDAFLTRVVTAKKTSFIRAWEESEKAKAENKAARRLASVASWENSKVAEIEAELKKIHEQLEMKNAAQAEKRKNSTAAVHRVAEEKRAAAVARRGEEVIAAEEAAAKYRARGQEPTRLFGLGHQQG
ncbi:remorin [Sorghum bicolor]|uniref:remorin n=1 Tax=Sorghum bicolor TaxID=4558 RepID=UPI000B4240AD|nr:remorin [Sorghum bicolor]|eukprot:XP_021304034.1 remorin [Sorghum bicolor]